MAGLYLHIPFCKQACHYCNFHFSTTRHLQQQIVESLAKEMQLQRNFLPTTELSSIYFGGGTPSLLTAQQLDLLFNTISKYFTWPDMAEITLEANPDDLTDDKLNQLAQSPINRLSIGTQSFQAGELQLMNRAHTVAEALSSIKRAQDKGFHQLNIDLIYGMPGSTLLSWQANIEQFLALQIPHLSSYCLTIEPRTALAHHVEQGIVKLPEDDTIAAQYHFLHDQLCRAGYTHYEISNFALPNALAQHNTSYWQGAPYLGIGPSAHSYLPGKRQWNIAHNVKYLQAIAAGNLPAESETLDTTTAFNEYLLTHLRTYWGVDLTFVHRHFGPNYAQQLRLAAKPYLEKQQLHLQEDCLLFDPKAWLVSDGIISDLFQ